MTTASIMETMNPHRLSTASASTGLPSPTLTNPDMILPYGDYSRNSTPSPPLQAMRLPSDPLAGSLASHFGVQPGSLSAKRGLAPIMTPPVDPYGQGTELSDIEEVETTPTKPTFGDYVRVRGKRRAGSPRLGSRNTNGSGSGNGRETGSGAGNGNGNGIAKETVSGNGTPTQETETGPLERSDQHSISATGSSMGPRSPSSDYGDDASIADEDLYGDAILGDRDRESSPAETSTNPAIVAGRNGFLLNGQRSPNSPFALSSSSRGPIDSVIPEDPEEGDEEFTSNLSEHAERILASAKRRLDNMEGNLTKARHSLVISPSPYMSSSVASSPYSPRNVLSPSRDGKDRRIHPGLGISPAKHRQLHSSPSLLNSSPGHNRVSSETSVPSSLYTSPQSAKVTPSQPRAKSAMDGGRRFGLPINRSTSVRESRSIDNFKDSSSPGYIGTRNYLSPLYTHSSPGPYHHAPDTTKSHQTGLNRISTQAVPNPNGLARSQSTLQMRDVRDQMNDLKGRISSLQQRAREDSLRRRSLQSLRTPSPFTAAEQWYHGGANSLSDQPGLTSSAGVGVANGGILSPYQRSMEGQIEDADDEQDDEAHESPRNSESEVQASLYEDADEEPHALGEVGVDYDDAAEENPPELVIPENEESYAEGEEREEEDDEDPPSPTLVAERHEDRADAFDYETFYLHSAMGTYARANEERRKSNASFASDESGETTRGVEPNSDLVESPTRIKEIDENLGGEVVSVGDEPFKWTHQRQVSSESVSTVATYATATEGENSDDDDDSPIKDAKIISAVPWQGGHISRPRNPSNHPPEHRLGQVFDEHQIVSPNPISRMSALTDGSGSGSGGRTPTRHLSGDYDSPADKADRPVSAIKIGGGDSGRGIGIGEAGNRDSVAASPALLEGARQLAESNRSASSNRMPTSRPTTSSSHDSEAASTCSSSSIPTSILGPSSSPPRLHNPPPTSTSASAAAAGAPNNTHAMPATDIATVSLLETDRALVDRLVESVRSAAARLDVGGKEGMVGLERERERDRLRGRLEEAWRALEGLEEEI